MTLILAGMDGRIYGTGGIRLNPVTILKIKIMLNGLVGTILVSLRKPGEIGEAEISRFALTPT